MGHNIYWGHEHDVTMSHDVIDHMTIQLAICYFLLPSLYQQPFSR